MFVSIFRLIPDRLANLRRDANVSLGSYKPSAEGSKFAAHFGDLMAVGDHAVAQISNPARASA
jgi:hypothetical protein